MGAGAAVGAPVVVLDEAVVPLGLLPEERGRSLNWIVESLGPAGGRSGPHVFAGGLRAETALAPVHLRAKRLGSGDIEITWKRRSRLEGDSWDGSDIPLDEPDERYRVELLEGTAVKRTAEVAEPLFVYPASDELADFGAPQASLSLRVRQLGRAVPLGIPAETIVIVED